MKPSNTEPLSQSGKNDRASDPRWQLTQRLLQSEGFQRAPRLREFLLFIVERTLSGHAEEISEYEIGLNVFKRGSDFNPAEDSVVRSMARHLRTKLQEYFEAAGEAEPIVLEVPKGGYVPEFVSHPVHATPASSPKRRLPGRTAWLEAALVACILIILGLLVFRNPRDASPKNLSPGRPSLASFVFDRTNKDVNLVLADAALSVANSYRRQIFTLDDYIRYAEQKPLPLSVPRPPGATFEFPGGRLLTVYQNAAFAERLGELGSRKGWIVRVRHSRLMKVRDFRQGNFLLLGNPWSTPWVDLFESRMNFRFVEGPNGGGWGLKNTAPRPGELPLYSCPPAASRNGISYARLAVQPNLTRTGMILLISGLHAEGTEAAGDAALSPDFFKTVEHLAQAIESRDFNGLEMLLEIKSVDGVVERTRILASRVPAPQPQR